MKLLIEDFRVVRRNLWAAVALLLATTATALPAERFVFHNHRLFIAASVNGVPTEALLDSAAEASLVDTAFAVVARLPGGEPISIRGSGGTASARVVEGVEIKALGIAMHPEAVAVTDLGDISRRLARRRVNLIVGRELFDSARLAIDFQSGTIERVSPISSPGGVELPLTAHSGVESIPVKANGVAGQAEFDLGNGAAVLISNASPRNCT